MTWIKALNGNVIDVPDDLADILVAQGHERLEDAPAAVSSETPDKPAIRRRTK